MPSEKRSEELRQLLRRELVDAIRYHLDECDESPMRHVYAACRTGPEFIVVQDELRDIITQIEERT